MGQAPFGATWWACSATLATPSVFRRMTATCYSLTPRKTWWLALADRLGLPRVHRPTWWPR